MKDVNILYHKHSVKGFDQFITQKDATKDIYESDIIL